MVISERDTAEETRVAALEIWEAQQRTGANRVLIEVLRSRAIFRVQQYGLSDLLARLAGVPGMRVALASDTAEQFAAHSYIEFLARQRALDVAAFPERASALRWLLPELPASSRAQRLGL